MKETFCIAVFAGKVLGLVMFISALRPNVIGAVEASIRPIDCKIELSRAPGCSLNLVPASDAGRGACAASPSVSHC
jgi:hypothetical protein